jgi:5-formyltetrahydrofolate cyclo-ligase
VIFVPLLAFDGHGNRLGYGGGFYDRSLAARPGCEAIGFGYEAQRVELVPHEAFDRPLPRIVTEAGLFLARR